MTKRTCLVVGAGIAGTLAAARLREAGFTVTVLDKGRNFGGRMATRQIDEAVFDHGAQFITVRDPRFERLIQTLRQEGIVYEWCRGFGKPDEPYQPDGHPRYQGTAGMSAIVKHLARGLDVRLRTRVTQLRISDGGWTAQIEAGPSVAAQAAVITTPVPQALDLLDLGGFEMPDASREELERVKYHPCLALMVLLDGPSRIPPPGALRFEDGPLSFIADNRMKGISPDATAVTIHAGPAFSREHATVGESAVRNWMLSQAKPYLGNAEIRSATLHRWRFAQPIEPYPERCLSVPAAAPLVFAGDAFAGPRVEGAALSGLAAADELLRTK